MNTDSQKKDINSNSIRKSYNSGEHIFQDLEDLGYHLKQKKDRDSNSMRENHNNGEPIFQTREEALRGDLQK